MTDMTPTTLAETILRDVQPTNHYEDEYYKAVLAALTAALDPALSGRAVEVLEGVTPGPWWTEPEGTVRNDADGNPRYDLPRFVRYDKTGHTVCKTHLIGGVDPDPALANARFIAWCREGVPSLIARIAAMEVQIKGLEGGIEAACDREAETERKLRTALAASETRAEAAEAVAGKLRAERDELSSKLEVERFVTDAMHRLAKAAEAQNAALTARVERLTGAHIFADAARDAADAKLAEVEKERDDWIEITARTEDALRRRTRQLADADAKAEAAEATIATLTEKVEAMRGALKYYKDTFCEGFCGEDCWSDEGHSHPDLQRDCSGCLAASVLIRAAIVEASQ